MTEIRFEKSLPSEQERVGQPGVPVEGIERYFAKEGVDPLPYAFEGKIAVHPGLGGARVEKQDFEATLEPLLAQPRKGKTVAYIHVPFCETRCLYCMFYQNPWKEEATTEYAKQLVKELELWSDRAAQNAAPINALYFGGGTPTAFSPDDIRLVMGAVKKYLPLANDCEITLEGRIHNFSDAKMDAAIESGVNRFSLGVQTFNTQIRQSVMRVDDRDTIIRRLDKLCSYNNASVVCDMIYGFPGQTMEPSPGWMPISSASTSPSWPVRCSGSWRTSTSSNANAVVWADPAYSKKFLEEHREQITLHKAAKAAFDEASLKKLPKVKELDTEYSALLSQKKAAYPKYRKARDEMQELKKTHRRM